MHGINATMILGVMGVALLVVFGLSFAATFYFSESWWISSLVGLGITGALVAGVYFLG